MSQANDRVMRAVVTDPGAPDALKIVELPRPTPLPHEALVGVRAFSLNAGETRTALAADRVYTPGWDFAGIVERASADGSSPAEGTPVFGSIPLGAWAEHICVPGPELAVVPPGVALEQAAALPVAALTALQALESYGSVLGRRVLITGASGGVGRYAAQLAHLGGAFVFLVSRRPSLAGLVERDGVGSTTIFADMAAASRHGSYDLILDSVGGAMLAAALDALAPGGTCINFGNSSNDTTTFDVRRFYLKGNTTLRGLYLGTAPANRAPALTRLALLVAEGKLRTPIDRTLSWIGIAEAARSLVQQAVDGKIVLLVD